MSPEEGLKIRQKMISLYEARLDSYQSMILRAKEQDCHDLTKFPEFIELADFIVDHAPEQHEIELLWSEISPELQQKILAARLIHEGVDNFSEKVSSEYKTRVTLKLTATDESLASLTVRYNGDYQQGNYEEKYLLSFFPETPFKDKIKS